MAIFFFKFLINSEGQHWKQSFKSRSSSWGRNSKHCILTLQTLLNDKMHFTSLCRNYNNIYIYLSKNTFFCLSNDWCKLFFHTLTNYVVNVVVFFCCHLVVYNGFNNCLTGECRGKKETDWRARFWIWTVLAVGQRKGNLIFFLNSRNSEAYICNYVNDMYCTD